MSLFKSIPALWQAFLDFYHFDRFKVILCFMLMLIQGATSGIGILLIIPLLQIIGLELTGGETQEFALILGQVLSSLSIPQTLESILILYVGLVTIVAALKYWVAVLSVELQQHYVTRQRDALFRSLLHAHWSYITANRMSDFTHSLTGQVQKLGFIANKILSLFSQAVVTLVYISMAFLLSWEMTGLALICAAVLFTVLLPLNKKIYASGETQLFAFKDIFRMLTEQLSSIKMIKSYAAEDYYANQLDKVGITLENQTIKMARINGVPQFTYTVGAVIAFSLLFYFSFTWLQVSVATLLLLLFIFSRLLPQISGIQTSFQQLLHNIPAFTDVKNMLDNCSKAAESENKLMRDTPKIKQCIRVENLSFKYPAKEKAIIENLSFYIEKNQTVAFSGASGTGKSTLADLVAGLLKPTSGTIYCDQQPLVDDVRLAWRRHIAYVTQEVHLFNDSLRNNLTWVSQVDVSDEQIWHALEMAAAKNFVEKLPDGLDSMLGDRGVRLSGGERQRLAIARALISDAQLLILDEATSALDHENEVKIKEALKLLHGTMTIILIAHRKTTIAHVDQVIELDG